MGGDELNVPAAPLDPGTTVNVTAAPCTPLPAASVTLTSSAVAKAWPTGVLWPPPAILVTLAGTSPLWVTVTACPNTVIFAVRLVTDVLAWNEKPIAPPPVPVIVSQDWLLVAVRGVVVGRERVK